MVKRYKWQKMKNIVLFAISVQVLKQQSGKRFKWQQFF